MLFFAVLEGAPKHRVLAASAPVQAAAATADTIDAEGLYEDKCSLCHGLKRVGNPPAFPTLIGVTAKYTDAQITDQIRHGKGRMPAFPSFTDAEVAALVALLKMPPPADPVAVPAP